MFGVFVLNFRNMSKSKWSDIVKLTYKEMLEYWQHEQRTGFRDWRGWLTDFQASVVASWDSERI